MNIHLPLARKTLETLLKEEKPSVVGRDGSIHVFKNEELELLARIIPKRLHSQLKLPIYIEFGSGDWGSGVARIRDKVNLMIVEKLIDIKVKEDSNEIFLYRPDIIELRKILPTTTQYAFLMSI